MNKLLTQLTLLSLAIILMSSCSQMSLTKRSYRKGYYLDINAKKYAHMPRIPSIPTTTGRLVKNGKLHTAEIKQEQLTVTSTPTVTPQKTELPVTDISISKKEVKHKKLAMCASLMQDISQVPIAEDRDMHYLTRNAPLMNDDVRVDVNVSFVVIVLCAI